MSPGLKGSSPTALPGGDTALRAENAKLLLGICLKSVHDLSRRYFYSISGEESVPGTLSYLLSIKEADLIEIFKICGFYRGGRRAFQRTIFETWVRSTFESGTVEVTTYKKQALIKIGHGEHPKRPADQVKENLDPPQDSEC